ARSVSGATAPFSPEPGAKRLRVSQVGVTRALLAAACRNYIDPAAYCLRLTTTALRAVRPLACLQCPAVRGLPGLPSRNPLSESASPRLACRLQLPGRRGDRAATRSSSMKERRHEEVRSHCSW